MQNYKEYMALAIEQAGIAASLGEVPVGAVIVKDGKVIAKGYNRRESDKNALAHAEIEAINEACKVLGGWRLFGCDLYVTLEPCPMCAGAIINARLDRVIFGASDPKAGCAGSVVDLFDFPFNHKPEVIKGISSEICSSLLSNFFKNLRSRGNETKK